MNGDCNEPITITREQLAELRAGAPVLAEALEVARDVLAVDDPHARALLLTTAGAWSAVFTRSIPRSRTRGEGVSALPRTTRKES